MNGDDYTRLSTDSLVQTFIEIAKATGNVFALDLNQLKTLNEESVLNVLTSLKENYTDARVQEMQALGAELRRRKPVADARRLFEHDDRDVRGWAGAQLDSVDPEGAQAALWSLHYDLTTQEVLAWRRRILQKASPKPGTAGHDSYPAGRLLSRCL